MRIMIACEFSGVVRNAFLSLGHDAISCDLIPTELPGPHIQADIRSIDLSGYDLLIAHPPCQHLAISGARWMAGKKIEIEQALGFVKWLLWAPVPRIAIENPVGLIGTHIRKSDQIIQPWMFGHNETKKTCLWLKNLPLLRPTNVVEGREPRILNMPESPHRAKDRSRTYAGIAAAMATQWGNFNLKTYWLFS